MVVLILQIALAFDAVRNVEEVKGRRLDVGSIGWVYSSFGLYSF